MTHWYIMRKVVYASQSLVGRLRVHNFKMVIIWWKSALPKRGVYKRPNVCFTKKRVVLPVEVSFFNIDDKKNY